MKYWMIYAGNAGEQLGCWAAETAEDALEQLARAAGYSSKAEADRVLLDSGGSVYQEHVEEITEDEYNAIEEMIKAGYSDQGDALRDYREAVYIGDTWMLDAIVYDNIEEWKGLNRLQFNQALSNANHDPFPVFETSTETDAAYDAAWKRLQREAIIAAIEEFNGDKPEHWRVNFDECKADYIDPDVGEWKPYGIWTHSWDGPLDVFGTIEECKSALQRLSEDEALQERGWGEGKAAYEDYQKGEY